MDDLDEVLEALSALERAEGLGPINEALGPELSKAVRKLTKIEGAGSRTARELVLKIGRLWWAKVDHKKTKARR